MNRLTKIALATLVLVWVGNEGIAPLSAGDLVSNPETIFKRGMRWSERNGANKGVLQLNSDGSARINWNGISHRGHWEKVDEYRVRTLWNAGGPPGSIWTIRETGDKSVPYVASRSEP